jgi:hypothetical protein
MRVWRSIFTLVAVALVQSPPTFAVEQLSKLERFLLDHRCAVLERLAYIHTHGDVAGPNRFLVLEIKNFPQRYVQCLFLDKDSKILCEASSGFYFTKPDEPRQLRVKPRKEKILGRLGFSTDGTEGNYQRMIEFGTPPDLLKVADLMLTTLYEVYGAQAGIALEMKAPLVPEGAIAIARCSEGA